MDQRKISLCTETERRPIKDWWPMYTYADEISHDDSAQRTRPRIQMGSPPPTDHLNTGDEADTIRQIDVLTGTTKGNIKGY